jgi:hypothetical protein
MNQRVDETQNKHNVVVCRKTTKYVVYLNHQERVRMLLSRSCLIVVVVVSRVVFERDLCTTIYIRTFYVKCETDRGLARDSKENSADLNQRGYYLSRMMKGGMRTANRGPGEISPQQAVRIKSSCRQIRNHAIYEVWKENRTR